MTEQEKDEREKIAALWVKIRETEGAELLGMEAELRSVLLYIQDNLARAGKIDQLEWTLEKIRASLLKIMRIFLLNPPDADRKIYTASLAIERDRLEIQMVTSFYPFELLKKYVQIMIPQALEAAKQDLIPCPSFWTEHCSPIPPPSIEEIIRIEVEVRGDSCPLATMVRIED